MPRRNFITLIAFAAIAAICLPATLLHAALSTPAQAPDRAFLTGQLLVASPAMGDPRFYHAVILMVQHDQKGALGIVINRLLGERPLASVLDAVGEKDPGVTGNVSLFLGGPVQPEIGFVLHTTDYRRPGTIDIDGHVAMTSDKEILRDIGRKQGPRKSLIAFGYAGWAAGQLEGELKLGAWITATQDEHLIFDEDRAKVWDEATRRRTQDL